MNYLGIFYGSIAAFFMAVAFVCSAGAIRKNAGLDSLGFLVRAHAIMGGLSLIGLVCLWCPEILTRFSLWFPVAWYGVFFYLLAQGGVFWAQRFIDSSRIVPLLGLKLVVLALLNAWLFGIEVYGWQQITGIACAIFSAFLLNNAGKRVPWKGLLLILLVCTGYSLSDICLKEQVIRVSTFSSMGVVKQSILSTCLTYTIAGGISTIVLLFLKPQPAKVLGYAFPFAVAWMLGIIALTPCFQFIGTVNGNIVQSTRGIWAIILGAILARCGQTCLEEKTPWSLVLRRLAAASLLIFSIYIYNLKA